jgi:hypothetical protein
MPTRRVNGVPVETCLLPGFDGRAEVANTFRGLWTLWVDGKQHHECAPNLHYATIMAKSIIEAKDDDNYKAADQWADSRQSETYDDFCDLMDGCEGASLFAFDMSDKSMFATVEFRDHSMATWSIKTQRWERTR